MNRAISSCLLIIFMAFSISVLAQKATGNKVSAKPLQKAAKRPYLLKPQVYMGSFSGGVIHRKELGELLKKGLSAHDSVGNKYHIVGFDFTYAEQNDYEDEIGNRQILVDYMSEYCAGDTLTTSISATIYDRIKSGDTLYIDNVQLQPYPHNTLLSANDTSVMAGKGMKCIIVK